MYDNRNIAALLDEHAIRRARHPAIIEDGRVLNYAELAPLVRRTARLLGQLDISNGDIVGVCLKDSANHLVVMFALARLGAVILPLDWRWRGPEKQRIARFFGVKRVIVEPGDVIAEIQCDAVDDAWHGAVSQQEPESPCAMGGDQPLVLSLSSGTTGRPKGPMLSHRQFIARLMIQWVTLGFSQHDRYLSATPLYFGGGRSFTLGSLFSGGTVIMFPPPYEPEQLVTAVAKLAPTTMLLVPTLLRRLLALPDTGAPLLGGLKRLLSTGAVLHPDERAEVMARLHPEFINYYGSTEGGGITVLLPEHQGSAAASVGEPVFATEVAVVDEDAQVVAAGQPGLVRYRGPAVAESFHLDAGASVKAFRDGWFYPGDIGKLDSDGRLYLVGRAKDVIIRAGVNIYPGEIEQVLLSHPIVRDAAVVAWPSLMMGEEIAAYVITDSDVDLTDLEAHCRAQLASYKIPRRIFTLTELPKSPLGKVLKADLAAQLPSLDGD
ncbi:MAG: AMP-binding protein [Alphaproteobacteria bacterium]